MGKYFIGHLIKGELRKFHESLTSEISKKFNVNDVSKRIMPHITFKAPFEIENIRIVEEIIEEEIKKMNKVKYKINSFSSFNKKVIFLDGDFPSEMKSLAKELQKRLGKVEEITLSRHEGGEEIRFHLTVCYAKAGLFEKMIDHLKKKRIKEFEEDMDNIAIFKKEKTGWVIQQIYNLQGQDNNQ